MLYSFLYYRGLGVVSVSSLAIAALLTYLAVVLLSKYESFTLSLAGIAGLIVAIGITADSFVVFFERLRDEVREGRSLRAAVERGWARARRTILVSDTVSFLAAALLYIFAIGDVKGFAFTLGLTTLDRHHRGVPVHQADGHPAGQDQVLRPGPQAVRAGSGPARHALALAGRPARSGPAGGRRPEQPAPTPAAGPDHPEGGVMSRLGNIGGRLYRGEVSFDFVGRQKLWYTISGLILVISIAALLIRGLNYSVDFKGGSIFQFTRAAATTTQIATVVEERGRRRRRERPAGQPIGTAAELAGADRAS